MSTNDTGGKTNDEKQRNERYAVASLRGIYRTTHTIDPRRVGFSLTTARGGTQSSDHAVGHDGRA